MPQYINLINYTEQGLKNVKNMPNRVTAAGQAMQSAGGKLVSFHLTLGQYDAVVILEAPDDQTVAEIGLALAARGNVRTETLRAFTEDEYQKIVGKLP